ncbi:MAG: dihydroorotase [Syntrophomonadaceae bacterium]|jgi:dihydroorotase|nr:dihydroorotase [Syntrophomonadaceae bacterium]
MKLLVKGGQVIDPANNRDDMLDILVEDGKISKIGRNLKARNAEILDAAGKIVCPGFIDIHAHLREPGFEYKEDLASGTRAAAAGGFTTVCCMPNTNPVIDNMAVARFVRERAKRTGVVNVLPIGSITKQQAGEELSEYADLIAAGCVALSDDGKPVSKADVMRHALEYTRMFGVPVLSHCEDLSLSAQGQMHEGFYSTYYGLKGIPAAAEEVMVARDIILARLTGGRLHICHASTLGTMDLIRQAKAEGLNVTCEVTPHHLTLSDEIVGTYDADTKVMPPLRSQEHIEALRAALLDGTIDCIATDHAPHHLESKDCEYNLAAVGISGLETAVAVVMDQLVNRNLLTLNEMVRLFTCGPADVMGLAKGRLNVGEAADITIIDPHLSKTVDPQQFYSKGKNTPFKNMHLTGWPWATIVRGRLVYCDGSIIEE